MNSIEEIIEDVKQGKIVILVDDEDRENEGDFVIPAENSTAEAINFMATHGRGLICLSLTQEDADRLALQPIKPEYNEAPEHTAFTVPIDAKKGVTTGISTHDRASTIRQAISEDSRPEDFVRPGHIFPLIAKKGGVLVRAGHTEASVDISRLAGFHPASVICEIMKENGDMARLEDLMAFSKKHGIKIATIADLIRYRIGKESFVRRVAEAEVPTEYGVFRTIAFENEIDGLQHMAFVKGELSSEEDTLVRVHSDCAISDIFGSLYCHSRAKLTESLRMIEANGSGVLVYINQESSNGGFAKKITRYSDGKIGEAPALVPERQELKAELRHYGVGAQILRDLGVRDIRLLTNNPVRVKGLEGFGLRIVGSVAVDISDYREKEAAIGKSSDYGNIVSISK